MQLVLPQPKTVRAQRRFRRVFLAGLVAILVVSALVVWWSQGFAFPGHRHPFWMRLTPAVSTFVGGIALMVRLGGDYRTEQISTWALALTSAVGGAPLVYGIVQFWSGLPTWPAAAITAGTSAAIAVWLRRHIGKSAREQLRTVKQMAPGADVDLFIEEAERQGNKITLARGLIRRSADLSRPDDLARATDLLREASAELPEDEVLQLFGAAADLVGAMEAKYTRSEDTTGYLSALHVLYEAAARLPFEAETQAIVCFHEANYHLSQLATADGIAEKHLLSAALGSLRGAYARATPALVKEIPQLPGMLAELAYYTDEMTAEEAIELCVEGQARAGLSARRRAYSQQALGSILMTRVEQQLPSTPQDVYRAIWAFRRARRGTPGVRMQAWAGLAYAVTSADLLGIRPRPDERIAAIWDRAYRENLRGTSTGLIEVAGDWVSWAETTGDPALCAPAYRALMAAVPLAAGPHYERGRKDRLLARVQARAEEAGWWLLRAGDPEGAAVALEQGRAVAMREITGRNDPAVESALLEGGHTELAARLRDAVHALDQAERGRAEFDDFTSGLQRAAADFDRVRREIDALGLGGGTDLEEIRRAAVEGPVVYLAAADAGGYAVIVRANGDPMPVAMPELTRDAVRHAVDELDGQEGGGWVERFAAWLWESGLAELDRRLGEGELVTIVAVGLLGLLPVHIAAVRDPDGGYRWRGLADRNDFRYAPSARILRTSQARAAALTTASVVAVAAPDETLAYVVPEVNAVAEVWRDQSARVTVLPHATADDVFEQLPRHSVWHLACHGRADPENILRSRLQLTDGQLTLSDLLRLPAGVRRLAVLSSCESHRIGHELPDEVIGLPGGMLQLGLAGVVASHWEVDDRASALLMARFHELHGRGGRSPARALNEAQRWLRGATSEELRAAYPELMGDRSARFAHPYFWGAFTLTGA
jgi:CHAT domain-containing protein